MSEQNPSFLHQNPADLSDAEIRVALVAAAERRDHLAAEGRPSLAAQLQAVALVLAGLRDERRQLRQAVDDACNPFAVTPDEHGDTGS